MVKNTYSLQTQKTKENLAAASPFEEDIRESEMSRDLQERLLSKCALFVSNKLDILEEKDVQNVKEVVFKKLTKIWPGVDPLSQVVFMSAKNATNAQKYGFVAGSFSSLMRKLNGVITQGIEYRLEIKWRWLNEVLSRTIAKTKSSLKITCQDQKDFKKKVKDHIERLEYAQKHEDEIMAELRKQLEIYQSNAVTRAQDYLSSEEVKERFTSWTEENVPQEELCWSLTEENIQRALSNRFKETLQHWLKDYMLLAGALEILQQVLQKYFPHGEDQLRGLSDGLEEGSIPSYRKENLRFGGVAALTAYAAGYAFYTRQAASLIFSLAIPTSLVALSLSLEVFQYLRRRWDAEQFAEGKEAFMSKQSRNFLAQMADQRKLSSCVKLLLEPVERYLDEIGSTFPTLIAAEMEELRHFENEKRSLDDVKDAYAKIYEEGCRQRGQHALLGLTEMSSIHISDEALQWKADIYSRLGSGSFGDVYTGKMKQDRETKNVALKVSKKKLNAQNACEVMDEIELLRTLNGHRHIVQFYGIPLPVDFLAMVFEKCKGSLADYIFKDKKKKQSVPDTSKEPPFGIQKKFQWAREITDGLAFIHAKKVVHRDLKPENILVSEENSIKIADVGLAKPAEIITGTVAGTYVYMAPEVYDSKKYNEKVDIYSLGIILWEMWYGKRGYRLPRSVEEFFRWLKKGNRPVNEPGKEPPWNHLMKQCWSGNPENRPTTKECKREIERVCSLK